MITVALFNPCAFSGSQPCPISRGMLLAMSNGFNLRRRRFCSALLSLSLPPSCPVQASSTPYFVSPVSSSLAIAYHLSETCPPTANNFTVSSTLPPRTGTYPPAQSTPPRLPEHPRLCPGFDPTAPTRNHCKRYRVQEQARVLRVMLVLPTPPSSNHI
ncbi:hypothetical protein J3F84DRAFT_377953, partial [Trichoderma pleuroticola]